MIKNIIGHTKTVAKHKWIVFKLACRAGIPWRGFVHDLSKFSPTEFGESVKYYVGVHSPITEAKKDKGYSEAWLHHKGRNKHHLEYWIDSDANPVVPVIPYKYIVALVPRSSTKPRTRLPVLSIFSSNSTSVTFPLTSMI